MNPTKLIGIILIVIGAIGLALGSFSYTKDTHSAKIGPVQLSVQEKETVNVPVWAGIGAIALGVVLMIVPGRRK
jgi:multidrug transporter EmrE-like cation transporter